MSTTLLRRLVLLALLAPLALPAAAQRVAFGARIGSLGPGLEGVARVHPRAHVRLSAHYLAYGYGGHWYGEALAYDIDVRLRSAALLLDLYPAGQMVRVSAGLLHNRNYVEGTARPTKTYTVGERVYTPERAGTVQSRLELGRPWAPYLGVGVGNALAGRRLGVTADVGAFYQHLPQLTMTADGLITPTAEQAPTLERAFHDFRVYPVLSLGVTLRL